MLIPGAIGGLMIIFSNLALARLVPRKQCCLRSGILGAPTAGRFLLMFGREN